VIGEGGSNGFLREKNDTGRVSLPDRWIKELWRQRRDVVNEVKSLFFTLSRTKKWNGGIVVWSFEL
jgi:hypothetical protein